MALDADEFIRRFLLHVLPQGLQRIRYYGLLGQHPSTFLPRSNLILPDEQGAGINPHGVELGRRFSPIHF
jgi:hypothetical protein